MIQLSTGSGAVNPVCFINAYVDAKMTLDELLDKIKTGEDSSTQFKVNLNNIDSLAAELVAFSNAKGGTIFVGVDDNGQAIGINKSEVGRLNKMISNACSQHVKSPITVHTDNVSLDIGAIVIAIGVSTGIDKPYFDKNGIIWLKNGADKRRINSRRTTTFVSRNRYCPCGWSA